MLCSCARDGARTHARRQTSMDKDDALLKILGKLRGGRLEDVADKLIALFRQPEWWEEEFDKQFVARGVVYLYRAGNSVACKTGIMLPFHHHERGQRDGITPLFLPVGAVGSALAVLHVTCCLAQ